MHTVRDKWRSKEYPYFLRTLRVISSTEVTSCHGTRPPPLGLHRGPILVWRIVFSAFNSIQFGCAFSSRAFSLLVLYNFYAIICLVF